ncbi:methylaspartate mutase [Leisingera sp. ANG59]|uniref:methylaspartate mutase n=1 Tax=Leisingera sp. ANG59 TaxID=2675221 RepID=UPI001572D00B|nr:methylaspartate mutase [Leisingera sp. ANG59]NSY39776.1 methylaspartate mutase [Leisingera sp. ANG59]
MLDFNKHVLESAAEYGPVVQPRMGFSDPQLMSQGLQATAQANANSVCTITLDAFTRVNNFQAAGRSIEQGAALNGYPIVNHPPAVTRRMLQDIEQTRNLPVQIRHGSPDPTQIFKRMGEVGVSATEGGPVSYCLPYSRVPLEKALADWAVASRSLSTSSPHSHVESFAGCMMGQMCDPVTLIALNILEGLFLQDHGVSTVSFSYAQGISPVQDLAAATALKHLAADFFEQGKHHLVLYVFMGFFPKSLDGFRRISTDALRVAKQAGVQRIILKTPVESKRIPTIRENVASMEFAAQILRHPQTGSGLPFDRDEYRRILSQASTLIDQVLQLDPDLSQALLMAFASGLLSIPYCLHPDNKRTARVTLTKDNYYLSHANEELDCSYSFLKNLRRNIDTYDLTVTA